MIDDLFKLIIKLFFGNQGLKGYRKDDVVEKPEYIFASVFPNASMMEKLMWED